MSVYFAESCGYIKIGYSRDPFARAATLTLAGTRPDDLPRNADVDLIGWVPGGTWDEGAYHARFMDRRVKGEWFRLSRKQAEQTIWEHPSGVDCYKLSAQATWVMQRNACLTRDDVERAGIRLTAPTVLEALTNAFPCGGAA